MKPRPYYTVIEKLAGESWKPQYGSYDKEDCREQIFSMCDDSHILTRFQIMKSGHTQAEINKAVAVRNQTFVDALCDVRK